MKIRFAVTPPGAALSEREFPRYLALCERLGFDTVWLSDVPLGAFGDPLIALAYAAGRTERLKLGANVVPLGRHPYWLAKQLAHLDRLSNGRLLLSFVPGLGQPAERAALGHARGDRGKAVDEMIGLLRRWWSGETVDGSWQSSEFQAIGLDPRPLQQPLEIWLGGKGPAALERIAALADGWLTSAATPAETEQARRWIMARAAALGRMIDAEHFGISMPYAQQAPDDALLAPLRARRSDADLSDVVAVGASQLRELIQAHIAAGLSKFVVRPLSAAAGEADWADDLGWLAEQVLPLQT